MAGNKKQRVRVKRAFFVRGQKEPLGVDSVLDFPIAQARELVAAGKVEYVQSDTKTTETDKPTPRLPVEPKDGKKAADGKK